MKGWTLPEIMFHIEGWETVTRPPQQFEDKVNCNNNDVNYRIQQCELFMKRKQSHTGQVFAITR